MIDADVFIKSVASSVRHEHHDTITQVAEFGSGFFSGLLFSLTGSVLSAMTSEKF